MRQPLNLLSVQSSINCCTDQDRHPSGAKCCFRKKKRKRKAKPLLGLPLWKHQNQERRICWMFKYRERETKRDREREDREDPHVNSHWGQRTVTALTKANSLEERSTSPVTVDHSIITSTGLTVSLRPTARSSYDRHAEWRQIWKVKLQRISQLRGENNQPLGRYSQGQKVTLFDQICEKLRKINGGCDLGKKSFFKKNNLLS